MTGLSRLMPVVQHFPNRALPDVGAAVRAELAAKDAGAGIAVGSPIAIGAGSRGVANIAIIVGAAVAHFRERGLRPFVFPAMGSHGAGTAEGQARVLAHYGITEAEVGCPIVSSLDVVPLGRTAEGIETFMDRTAYEAGAVFLINRVKWHTTFEAPIESGLTKMAGIGLGKLAGAGNYHRHAVKMGLGNMVRAVGRHVLASGKVIGGLAVLEDAHHGTAQVTALRAEQLETEEPKLLDLSRSWTARILFDDVDALIVDEMGKQISGVGMDSKIVNRHPYGGVNPWPWAARITRIYVRSLSPQSYGNAVGIGMADLISERLYESIDWTATRVNALTASNLSAIRTPLRVATDREALDILAATVGRRDASEVTVVWIRNTLELGRILASENLVDSARGRADIERAGEPVDWEFDGAGNLAGGYERFAAGLVAA
jgi:hypothetical protein